MTKNTEHVLHIHSRQVIDGKPKLPTASLLAEGEIAVNYGENVETLSIKNESGTVVTFSSDNYYTEQKLGSAFTGSNSATTVTDILNRLEVGEEVEVNNGDTPTGDTIELWIDESIEPVTVEVYTKAETNALLNSKSDKADTVSNVSYDSDSGKLQETINGTTTDIVNIVNSGFRFEFNDGVLNLIPVGTATATVTNGVLNLTF